MSYLFIYHVHITNHLQDHLSDFELLAQSITTHPMRFAEIIPNYPSVIGSDDATKSSMGRVLFTNGKTPILWHASFPPDI